MSFIWAIQAAKHPPSRWFALITLTTILAPTAACGQGEAEANVSKLVVTVISVADKAPIAGAQIFVRALDNDLHSATDGTGKAVFSQVARGPITIRVVATGFEPAGMNATLEKAEETIPMKMEKSVIILKPPGN